MRKLIPYAEFVLDSTLLVLANWKRFDCQIKLCYLGCLLLDPASLRIFIVLEFGFCCIVLSTILAVFFFWQSKALFISQ